MISLKNLIKFTRFTHKFQQVKRAILVNHEDRFENDLEHSSQLALVSWYLLNSNKHTLDISKVLKYALAHDLVETYAGDVNFYKTDQKVSKQKLETKAAKRIIREFPAFKDLHKTIRTYELKSDAESKFVYALDKILPILNIYLDKGRTWKEDNVTLEMLITHKTKPVSMSPQIQDYFNKIIKILKKHKNYFPKIDRKKSVG